MFFISNNLITKNQSGFRSGDSTRNQLLILVNEIHASFDSRNSLEVKSSLTYPKPLTRYGTNALFLN